MRVDELKSGRRVRTRFNDHDEAYIVGNGVDGAGFVRLLHDDDGVNYCYPDDIEPVETYPERERRVAERRTGVERRRK